MSSPTILRRRWPGAAVLLLGILIACAEGARGPGAAADNASRPVGLARVGPQPDRLGSFEFRGAVELVNAGRGVGGLSGLAVVDGGETLVAVSDIGAIVTGRLHHEGGRLAGVSGLTISPLAGIPPRHGRPRENDSEDIVALPDGGWLVSFEGHHRIQRYRPDFSAPVELPLAPGMAELPLNGGMEAVARLRDGRLLALAEGADDGRPERQGWIAASVLRSPADWSAFTYRAAPGFRPTSAAVLPDGDVLVLERRFSLLGGFGARIARVPETALKPGAVVKGEELARLEPPLLTDNFEGIAAIPGPEGEALVYVISDDNFNMLQRTYLVMLALPAQRRTAAAE